MMTNDSTYFDNALLELQNILKKFFDKSSKEVVVYLFGSRVRNDFFRTSDIDIAIKNISKVEKALLEEAIDESNIIYKVDVSLWEELPKELKEEILKEGKIIYRNDRTEEVHRII
jgi:predicted nucleotidyltransferase